MGKIFCLIGKSASGKDSIYSRLLQDKKLKMKPVIPYTTRPLRKGEKDGESYYFCSEQDVRKMEEQGKIIELRTYDTVYGIWKYFTADDGQITTDSDDNYLLIGTLEAYTKIRDYFGKERVIPLYIQVDDGIRLSRALERERDQNRPQYAEMCRRFLADEKDFSDEKKRNAGIIKEFHNLNLEDTVEEIAAYIKGVC